MMVGLVAVNGAVEGKGAVVGGGLVSVVAWPDSVPVWLERVPVWLIDWVLDDPVLVWLPV